MQRSFDPRHKRCVRRSIGEALGSRMMILLEVSRNPGGWGDAHCERGSCGLCGDHDRPRNPGPDQRRFHPGMEPVPKGVPAREALVYFCAFISLASGLGLLWRRPPPPPPACCSPLSCFGCCCSECPTSCSRPLWFSGRRRETAVMVAGAWVLYTWFAADWDRQRSVSSPATRVCASPGCSTAWP